MKRDQGLAILAVHQVVLNALDVVKSLDLFGSVDRDEDRPDSDVDFLVEFTVPGGIIDLYIPNIILLTFRD